MIASSFIYYSFKKNQIATFLSKCITHCNMLSQTFMITYNPEDLLNCYIAGGSPVDNSVMFAHTDAPYIAFRPYMPVYSVRRGEDAEIYCDVDANPPVSGVTWSKDGVSLSGQ